MFSIDRRGRPARPAPRALMLATACALLLAPAAASGKTIVLKSIGPSAASYPRGTILPAIIRIELRRLDVLTLLDEDGTRSFEGPVSISLPLPKDRYRARPLLERFFRALTPSEVLSTLFRSPARPARRPETGSAAGESATAPPPAPAAAAAPRARIDRAQNLWLIDPAEAGTFCLPTTTTATIINRTPGIPMTLRRAGDAGAAGQAVTPETSDANGIAWPVERLPLVDGAVYEIESAPQSRSTIRIVIVPVDAAGLADPAGLAFSLIERGCDNQLERIARDAPLVTAK